MAEYIQSQMTLPSGDVVKFKDDISGYIIHDTETTAGSAVTLNADRLQGYSASDLLYSQALTKHVLSNTDISTVADLYVLLDTFLESIDSGEGNKTISLGFRCTEAPFSGGWVNAIFFGSGSYISGYGLNFSGKLFIFRKTGGSWSLITPVQCIKTVTLNNVTSNSYGNIPKTDFPSDIKADGSNIVNILPAVTNSVPYFVMSGLSSGASFFRLMNGNTGASAPNITFNLTINYLVDVG